MVKLVASAADDPAVLAIKQTLYRTSGDSPIVRPWPRRRARQAGGCLVELKARFDEEQQHRLGPRLEEPASTWSTASPAQDPRQGRPGRAPRERTACVRYVHLATGNYNAAPRSLYTDIGLFTCDEDIAGDVTNLFNYLTGYSLQPRITRSSWSRQCTCASASRPIDREIEHAPRRQAGTRSSSRSTRWMTGRSSRRSTAASQAGVKIELIVRSICGLRPGVPGVSDNVRVISIVGRFLEHARIFAFHSGDSTRGVHRILGHDVRNLDHRVEVLTPVEDVACQRELLAAIDLELDDTALAWQLHPDGRWEHVRPAAGADAFNSQEALMRRALAR